MSASSKQVGFCVLYRWKLRPGLEAQSISAWERATQLIMQQRVEPASRFQWT